MTRNPLLEPSWHQPSYVTFQAVTIPSAYTLMSLAHEQQWRSIQNQLAQFYIYQNNWDGLGSLAAPPSAFELADKLLKNARDSFGSAPSTATLSPSGAIQIEWYSGNDVLLAEISNRNRIDWAEFGPNKKPKYWSETIDLTGAARELTWEVTSATDERGADYASQT